VTPKDPNITKVELIARALGPLREQVVFVGGCSVGFSNRWYPLALATATEFRLPSGSEIRLIAAPVFVGTKFEAHASRGGGDLLASHDMEDIINVIDGRPTLLEEIADASTDLQHYLREQCAQLLAEPHFADYLPGLIAPGEDLAERAQIVAERLQAIAHMRD
jgi:hypothetical protein